MRGDPDVCIDMIRTDAAPWPDLYVSAREKILRWVTVPRPAPAAPALPATMDTLLQYYERCRDWAKGEEERARFDTMMTALEALKSHAGVSGRIVLPLLVVGVLPVIGALRAAALSTWDSDYPWPTRATVNDLSTWCSKLAERSRVLDEPLVFLSATGETDQICGWEAARLQAASFTLETTGRMALDQCWRNLARCPPAERLGREAAVWTVCRRLAATAIATLAQQLIACGRGNEVINCADRRLETVHTTLQAMMRFELRPVPVDRPQSARETIVRGSMEAALLYPRRAELQPVVAPARVGSSVLEQQICEERANKREGKTFRRFRDVGLFLAPVLGCVAGLESRLPWYLGFNVATFGTAIWCFLLVTGVVVIDDLATGRSEDNKPTYYANPEAHALGPYVSFSSGLFFTFVTFVLAGFI